MTKKWTGYAAAFLTASLTLGGAGTMYGGTLTLAGFGADQQVEEPAQPQTEAQTEAAPAVEETVETQAPAEAAAQTEAQTEVQTEAQTEPPVDRSMVDTTGFAKSEETINVRVSGDNESEIVGTLNLNDSVYIEDVDEYGWYKVRSGNVEGYVAGYLIATGEEAEAVAQNTAYTYATVGAETLNIRADASEDSEVVDMAGQDADLEVVEDLGDWVKVVTPDGVYGYVSTEYVNTQTVYPTGETVEEQAEREEQEYLEAVAQQEAEYAAYLAEQEAAGYTDAAYTDPAYTDTTYTDPAYTDTSYTDTTAYSGDVDALYQAYLTAQEAAMTATSEEDATTKANAAIDAYNAYIAACGSSATVAQVETASAGTYTDTTAADTTYTDTTYTDTTYTDTTSTGTTYTDTTSTDTGYTDTTADTTQADTSSSSGSGIGSQIASYATQFVGNPYVYGGSSLTNGTDCSGFTMSVMSNFGVSLPHNAAAQSGCGTQVSLSDIQPGDLLFYGDGGIGHVGIYIGNGSVVHASNPESGIKISSYDYRNPVSAVRCV